MPVIDADAHVIETDRTWDYLDGSDKRYRPFLALSPTDAKNECWIIDGQVRGSRFPSLTERELEAQSKVAGRHMETPRAARELDDVEMRLREYSGEDALVIGTDYGHTDAASEIDAITTLKTRKDIGPGVIAKILDDNPRALYGL